MKLIGFVGVFLLEICLFAKTIGEQDANISNNNFPVIVITWDYKEATEKAWDVIHNQKRSALDAIEEGCSLCEELQCRKTVGFGGSPDETGETTLDALIMDGVAMDVGGVGGLRDVKSAISVARKVLENTKHSLLGGSLATDFALQMGFKKESLETDESKNMWQQWKEKKCQPNFWKNVLPDPTTSCGPYRPSSMKNNSDNDLLIGSEDNHDTIGMLAIDSEGCMAAGTSTNGAKNKIPGRIGDSPIAGAGAYADQAAGAAAGTGDGDIMMRFLPSFLAVEEMRYGATPTVAARAAINRIAQHYPTFFGGVIALNTKGEYGAACNGMAKFPYYVATPTSGPKLLSVECSNYSPYCTRDVNGIDC
ncbi:PREDICTED: N(4)-(Beta-N-acetylglucosaminyl)-L-asparaginase-like [Dinoponera quadriceps]|uniref:N(4)-(beta-N-acetylglucosaminyl)-L-asparaginase n=1 Tax=Dinoponera quadriceps TaxID=609295 RepID=A0A6P3Y7W3_DINQU|nr:PREDICTED: N(4)-(Beta-N-acetylglucosaminyl)-L-asparaginase-like [Dinoponera quadriceps]XP_014486452.1 PREDICTED: N(4)-(Beta-N-acetylglucosaminyl)-L-asparaginase-like [Dinoponera quadriceps]XP_014486453.1 PREDICTED: N(4)-(Beta-N-acetylglucosaminyl)-L-asparaginase-like [Dinoponera quadriceps]